MCLDSFLKASNGNNRISKSRAFHNVGAAYINDRSKNELAHILLIGGTHNKQGSKDARVRIVVLLTLSLIKSHKYYASYQIISFRVKHYKALYKCCILLLLWCSIVNCLVCQKQNFYNYSVINF